MTINTISYENSFYKRQYRSTYNVRICYKQPLENKALLLPHRYFCDTEIRNSHSDLITSLTLNDTFSTLGEKKDPLWHLQFVVQTIELYIFSKTDE